MSISTPPVTDREQQSQRRRADAEVTRGIEAEINACHQLSAVRRGIEVSFFCILYLAGACWITLTPEAFVFKITGIMLMGIAMNSLGILIHEGLHGLLAKDPRWNHWFGFLCGLPLLISASAYRATHCDHHVEFGKQRDYGTYRQHLDNPIFIWAAYYAQLFFGSILYVLLIPILAWRSASGQTRRWIAIEYTGIATLIAVVIYLVPVDAILTFWLYPALVLMLLSNIRGLASHALGDMDTIYLSSRTVKTSRLVEILFLHENYHLEHHLFPQVPSYHLQRVHQLVWHRLPEALYAKSYLSFLGSFFKASLRRELRPVGRVQPARASATPK
ncbi:MAG: fatty acid desaturase [Puniceicoccaceae bacterium]|nr:MAG: fatty acid desaturase [Puniceicoccaceae bacterium]